MKKILVIDDDPTVVKLVKLRLQQQGYEVSAAYDGRQGLEHAMNSDPDLILLDIIMPEMDGYEVLKQLNSNDKTKTIPVIMLTAKGQAEDLVRSFIEGHAVDYILKPFAGAELLEKLQDKIGVGADEIKKQSEKILLDKVLNSVAGVLKDVIHKKGVNKILITDDDPHIAQLLEYRLKHHDYDVDIAYDGLTCIEKAKRDKPDLIILDIQLPDITGFDVCKRLRINDETRDIPVIILTASVRETELAKEGLTIGQDTGIVCFITKPFNPMDLLGEIESAIDETGPESGE